MSRLFLAAFMLVTSTCMAASTEKKISEIYSGTESLKWVLQLITRAEKTVDAELFLISDSRVLDALRDAAERGVAVRLLLEGSNSFNRKTARELQHKRIEIRWYKGKKKARVHARSACGDNRQLLVGSADWTRNSLSRDRETLVVLDGIEDAAGWVKEFNEEWARATLQPSRRYQLEDELKALPDPKSYSVSDPKVKLETK